MQHQQLPRNAHSQRGVAILTVLIIVALVMTLATVILARQSRTVRQTDNYQSLERAWQYAFALEQYVGMELQRNLKTNKYDALTESWARLKLKDLKLEEGNSVTVGIFTGKLEDLQARFNINNILIQPQTPPNQQQKTYLNNLIHDAGLPDGFTSAMIDWIDDDEQLSDGESAESDYYLSSTLPFRAANMQFLDPSELRLLRLTMSADKKPVALNKLQQLVSTIPTNQIITVNANTANKQVLTALGLNSQQIESIMDLRKTKPFETAQDLANKASLTSEQKLILGVSSNYFRLQGEIKVGRARVYLSSVFFRAPDKPIRVIMRQFDRVNDTQPATTTDDADTTPATS